MVPVVGSFADGANAAWYAFDGDWVNAGMSAAAAIPFLGDAAGAAKLAKDVNAAHKLFEAGKEAATVEKGVTGAKDAEKAVARPPGPKPSPTGQAGGDGGLHSPDFVVHPNGEAVIVPKGATGPTVAENGKGFQFQGGSGGHGLDKRTSGVRIMEPKPDGKYPIPNGYVKYNNAPNSQGKVQTVNPYTGKTVSRDDPWSHSEWAPR